MDSLRFTLPPSQARRPLIAAAVMIVLGGVLAVCGVLDLAAPLLLIAVVLLVVYFMVMWGSYGEFDETGIRSRRGVYRHHVLWENVREVVLDPKSGQVLVCHRHHGKSFKIGAPISGGLSVDKAYHEKVAQVLAYVAAHVPGGTPHGAGAHHPGR